MSAKNIERLALAFSVLGIALLVLSLFGQLDYRPGVLLLMMGGSIVMMNYSALKGYTFTAWVLVCVGFALAYPQHLIQWGDFKLSLLIVPLIQMIMFGMGTTLSLSDFKKILITPWPVFIGVVLQFGIMPYVGYMVATYMGFDGELAAGIVLIGSVSGGVASNLMAYIAGANVALSVTMTVVSTCLGPVMTPLLMSTFAGSFITVDTFAMMMGVVNIIVIPVVIGLLAHNILYSSAKWANSLKTMLGIAFVALMIFILGLTSSWMDSGVILTLRNGLMMGCGLILLVSLSKAVIGIWLKRPNTWMDKLLPFVSMIGICIILAVIIAQTHDVLMAAGGLLVVAAIIHNSTGYLLGYWMARLSGGVIGKIGFAMGWLSTNETLIDEASCRTVAFEVGMQNGGMATGLAMDVLKSHVAALPPNLFGTWMNISGSMLANYWKKNKPALTLSEKSLESVVESNV
ncbi:bile acid:sodium symporter family protein [Membranihabitans marinus]|uniref:bile acid:sodium symporter family protein n=1 Tax=Membranihabitans marinus TaxID=1227546 RepID=UPI001F42AD5A|nr:bile acid:sodium symporter family protein [Membranihabitans marinus]